MVSNTARGAERDFATPEAVAHLRAQPGFAQAVRASSAGLVSMYQGGHLLNWLMDDRGRFLFGYLALYLHATRDPADGSSGLTPTRMKAMCVEFDVCSPGRAGAMLSLMRFSGYLAPDIQIVDKRQRRLVATDKLYDLLRARWRLHMSAMAPLLPDGAALLAALDNPAFDHALMIAMVERFRSGFRLVHSAPGLGLFGERNAGMLILTSLIAAGTEDDTVPPQRPVPISIAALARRFRVSRPHVLKLIRDAADEGFLERVGADNSMVVLKPRLVEATQNFFATSYLFFADCAREAMRASGRESRATG
jgi:hypothetical protein